MAYNDSITRTGADALIPEDVSREIIQNVPQYSAVMSLGRRLTNMSRRQRRMPVLASLIIAGFVNGDTGLKDVSSISWENKYIYAEELAVIVPIPEAVLDDADYDIWTEIRPRIEEAFGAKFDAAVLFGTNAPSDWPNGLLPDATTAGNTVTLGTGTDIYDDIMAENGVLAKLEADGFMATGHVAAISMRSKLRGLRDTNGNPIFQRTVQAEAPYELDGGPMWFPPTDPTYGAFDATSALMFSGDWRQLVWAIRQDVTYKVSTEATIQDAAGNTVWNMFQQDMVALRCVMRLGWQLPNPLNRFNSTATRFPFSALLPT